MSFSYKTLSSNDITLTSYIANKFWEVKNSTLSENGVTIYIGENIPITRDYPFNPTNDAETSNEEYRRLIYDSIKNLFYKNYTSGSLTGQFFQASSYINYEQTTLTSGSMISAFKNLPQQTGSNIISTYNEDWLYDESIFDADKGSRIVVISIDQEVFGSGLTPGSVFISGSDYYLRDDGEGNLYNFGNENNYARYSSAIFSDDIYLEINNSTMPQLEYVGNIFYSHGLIIITNEDYLCIFGAPPTAINDYLSYFNLNPSQSYDIISNDYSDCGNIIIDSFTTHSIEGYTFPNFTYTNGFINIIPDQTSVIPGEYKLGYTIVNDLTITSNTASINLTVNSEPLQIENIISASVCFNNPDIVPVTFSINYGVPYYSYSLDGGNTYLNVDELFDITVSGSITASFNNIIYAKDYLNNITTQSFSSWYPEVLASINIQKLPCAGDSLDGKIFINNDQTAISASINGVSKALPALFLGIPTGSVTIGLTSSFGCTTSSIVEVGVYPQLIASVTQSNISCNGSNNGFLRVNFTNVIDNLRVTLLDPTGSVIYNSIPLSSFTNNSVTSSNLSTGSYDLAVFSLITDQCQFYSNIFNITEPTTMSYSVSASYIDSCSNQIEFNNALGGTPPYTYIAVNNSTNQIYSSLINNIDLETLGGNIYTTYLIDNNGCQSPTSSLEVYGRAFIYDDPTCEIE
jgi:hypothetical protein